MSDSRSARLAIEGGQPAITVPHVDRWRYIDEDEIAAVTSLLRAAADDRRVLYSDFDTFEREFAEFMGARFALVQCNGTSTIHAALFACGVQPGDEVITPSWQWLSAITPILFCGGTPVFCEVDPRTHMADPADIERLVTPKTKAVIVSHLYGNVVKMDDIMALSRKHGFYVIEDASQAHGAMYDGKYVGTIGHVGCFSMQASKAVQGIEAGMAITSDVDLYERMLIMSHYGYGRPAGKLIRDKFRDLHNIGLGIKYRANPMSVAMLRVQLKRLPELNERRRATFAFMDEALREIRGIHPVEVYPKATRGGLIQYAANYEESEVGAPFAAFLKALVAEGVQTQPLITSMGYGKMHLEPVFTDFPFDDLGGPWGAPGYVTRRKYAEGSLPISEALAKKVLWLPAFTDPEPGLMAQYVEAIAKVAANADRLASAALARGPESGQLRSLDAAG